MDPALTSDEDQPYLYNVRLSQIEYRLQRLYLHSRPRLLGLVLSNRCNIGCIHCYQAKNGDNLLRPAEIGAALRREFSAMYPFLSTLGVQGGEVFVIPGFSELMDDVAASGKRPIMRITTNGTLIDDVWAERIVRTPCRNVTISIDGATPATYAKLRRGGELESVLLGIRRLQGWKQKLGSTFPYLDSFFVIMRSNFREIPDYLRLMKKEGILDIAMQTAQMNRENTSRFPTLVQDETIASRTEVIELHTLLQQTLERERTNFRRIRVSGLETLFQAHGLDGSFLNEKLEGLYPDSDDLRPDADSGFELCPNPWTTMFIAENGDVYLCFLSEAIGNVYEAPLATIWNSPRALAKRSQMAAGRYMKSGCSSLWCSWREGKTATEVPAPETRQLLAGMKDLTDRAMQLRSPNTVDESQIAAVRRLLASREQDFAEFESLFKQLCDTNQEFHQRGQEYIDQLETELQKVRMQLESETAAASHPLVQIARKLSRLGN